MQIFDSAWEVAEDGNLHLCQTPRGLRTPVATSGTSKNLGKMTPDL